MRLRGLVLAGALSATAWSESPQVHADGSATLRFTDPNAKTVTLSIATLPAALPMVRGTDGVSLVDPANPAIKPNLLTPGSVLHVPGPASLPWESADIPHGPTPGRSGGGTWRPLPPSSSATDQTSGPGSC